MDADFVIGTTIPGSPSHAAAPHSQCHRSFLLLQSITSSRKRAVRVLAGPPSRPSVTAKNPPPSHALICKLRELASSNTLAAFGERKCKVYTARDVALGLIDVFGWSVEVDGKGEVGKVVEIVHVGRSGMGEDGSVTPYEYLLKVVRPFSSEEEPGQRSSTTDASNRYGQSRPSEVKILIPIINEFMQHIDPVKQRLLVRPPAGLLELAARPEAITKLQPEIQLFCKRYGNYLVERFSGNKKLPRSGSENFQKIVSSYMPTREQMFAVGRADLVRRIKDAGGFLYVANTLGLKSTRRPNGFWDDLQRLDFEIECFLLESWVKHVNKETGDVHFRNPITNEVTSQKPAVPVKPAVTKGKSSPAVGVCRRIMPRMRLVQKAGRWDLHHAIVWNGGYREVAHQLGRELIRSKN